MVLPFLQWIGGNNWEEKSKEIHKPWIEAMECAAGRPKITLTQHRDRMGQKVFIAQRT